MKTLTTEIDTRIVELAALSAVSKPDLISIAIQVLEEEYGSLAKLTPTDRFELIIAKIVIVYEDVELDKLYTALTNRGSLLEATQTLHTEHRMAS